MKKFVQRIIQEHKELYVRILKLDDLIYNQDTNHINRTDFANMCVQLVAMKQYEKCLSTRLHNNGVIVKDGLYLNVVDALDAEFEKNEAPEVPEDDCPKSLNNED